MTRLKLGMVGGGQGAFIGAVHRMAARLDDQWELVAGALSSDPERALTSSRELGISDDRSYSNFAAMAKAEAERADGIDAVAIVTPNHVHAGPAISFLNHGIHVICDKPLSATLDQARDIAHAVKESGKCFVLTHNYTGYPLVRQARHMIAAGELGDIRVVQVEYAQDWLAEEISNKQADWRTDPAKSGAGGCIGDIGTHAINLATFVTGLEVKEVAADLETFVPGRGLDDNAQVFLRFEGGAKGMLWSSQVAVGNENNLTLRIYGSKAGIEWSQENPNVLLFTRFGEPKQVLTRGGPGTSPADTRIPSGHPEGYLEAFGTIYADAAKLIRAHEMKSDAPQSGPIPDINDGVFGMAFVSACVKSSENNSAWVKVNS